MIQWVRRKQTTNMWINKKNRTFLEGIPFEGRDVKAREERRLDCRLLHGVQEIANFYTDQQQKKKERGDEKAREERKLEKR